MDMAALDFQKFRQVMLPVLYQLQSERKTAADLAREIKDNPRPPSAAEYLLLLAHECRLMYSRRERNYE